MTPRAAPDSSLPFCCEQPRPGRYIMQRGEQPDVRERLARHLFSTPPNGTPSIGAHTPISNDNLSNQIQEEQDHLMDEDEQDHPMDEKEHGSGQTSNGRADGKEFVGLTGKRQRCFKPHMTAYKDMTDIVHGYYKGIWTSASKADQSAKNTWFKEFGAIYFFYNMLPSNRIS